MLLATLPFWVGNSYYVNVATQMLIYAVFALGLNVLVGYAGLVTLGHAGAVRRRRLCRRHADQRRLRLHRRWRSARCLTTLVAAAIFAVLALRGTGLGFVMITVALGQIVWGIAYRWISLTNGDNGVSINVRPASVRPGADIGAGVLLGDAGGVPGRGRLRWRCSSPRRSAPPCAARATSRGA